MAGTIIADSVEAAATSQMVIKNGISSTPPQFQDGAGTQIGTLCRVWVNFNSTGTVAIRAAFNVTSITDNGVGDYTVNFTTALPDVNYAPSFGATRISTDIGYGARIQSQTTSALRINTLATTNTAVDYDTVNISVFR